MNRTEIRETIVGNMKTARLEPQDVRIQLGSFGERIVVISSDFEGKQLTKGIMFHSATKLDRDNVIRYLKKRREEVAIF